MSDIKRILSLDGGGIRGLVASIFLCHLERLLGQPLFEVFDLVTGTSTGGIISILIGCQHRLAKDIVPLYGKENADRIFDKDFLERLGIHLDFTNPRYDGKGKRALLRQYLKNDPFFITKPITYSMITAFDLNKMLPVMIKSWKENQWSQLDVADATSAAPTFFPPVKARHDGRYYSDAGAIGSVNNPAMCAYVEARKLWPDSEIRMVSVGTGYDPKKTISGQEAVNYGAIEWCRNGLFDMLMNGKIVHHQAKTLLGENYIRIDGALDNVEMDNCEDENLRALELNGQIWFDKFANKSTILLTGKSMGHLQLNLKSLNGK